MYTIEEIREKLVEILENGGIDLYADEYTEPLEIDSLQFITLIVQIEEMFDILVDEEMLTVENLSINILAENIADVLKNRL